MTATTAPAFVKVPARDLVAGDVVIARGEAARLSDVIVYGTGSVILRGYFLGDSSPLNMPARAVGTMLRAVPVQ